MLSIIRMIDKGRSEVTKSSNKWLLNSHYENWQNSSSHISNLCLKWRKNYELWIRKIEQFNFQFPSKDQVKLTRGDKLRYFSISLIRWASFFFIHISAQEMDPRKIIIISGFNYFCPVIKMIKIGGGCRVVIILLCEIHFIGIWNYLIY